MDLMQVMGPALACHGVRMNQLLILPQVLEISVGLLQGYFSMIVVSCVGFKTNKLCLIFQRGGISYSTANDVL